MNNRFHSRSGMVPVRPLIFATAAAFQAGKESGAETVFAGGVARRGRRGDIGELKTLQTDFTKYGVPPVDASRYLNSNSRCRFGRAIS
jgi:hypothetical protein